MLSLLRTLPQRLLIALVRAYRLLLSPWLGSSCRFEPTCSAYALQALQGHGATAGTYLTLRRLARCQPFCAGGHDPVPDAAPALFRRFLAAPPRADGFLSSPSIDKNSP
jgi:putative membrane protein insertion efficiency factor